MAKRNYKQMALFGELYAFLVVISPPDEVKAAIANIKNQLNKIANINDSNLHSIAHVTLTDKLTDDAELAKTIERLIFTAKPFVIKVNGWGVFNHGSSVTIYLKIENPEPIVQLMALVKSASKTPHISLAKKIPHETFNRLEPYLGDLKFSVEWVCNEIVVLRKLMSEKNLGFRDSFKIPL